jgi:hypothetical protein
VRPAILSRRPDGFVSALGSTRTCRADVAPDAREATERLLLDMRQALADHEHVDPSSIRIGPLTLDHPKSPGNRMTKAIAVRCGAVQCSAVQCSAVQGDFRGHEATLQAQGNPGRRGVSLPRRCRQAGRGEGSDPSRGPLLGPDRRHH